MDDERLDGCPQHQVPWKLVPAGVSKKTQKPYPAFYACPEFGCTQKPETAKEQVTREFHEDMEVPYSKPATTPTKAVSDDSAIWLAKERMGMAQSALKAAAEIVAARISSGTMKEIDEVGNVEDYFDDLKEKNYKWLVDKKEGK